MPRNTVQLSIILTTHAEQRSFDSLLNSILALHTEIVEIIIINDAADTTTGQYIKQAVERCSNPHVYLFEHEQHLGRGLSLNEALLHASGEFIWAPLQAESLNESLLVHTIGGFSSQPVAFWTLDHSLPEAPADWISAAEEGELPDDSCLVWNRNVISNSSLFFNPFLEKLHGAELAFRLFRENAWRRTDAFFIVADDQLPTAGSTDLREFLYTANRTCPDRNKKAIFERLENLETETKPAGDELLLQARQLLEQGDARRSLDVINRFLKNYPQHQEANHIKAAALGKLRRYVEAAEHKHHLTKQTKGPVTQAELFIEESKEEDPEPTANINLSVVIPTAALGKQPLETTLLHLEKAVDPDTTELIIVDNASIDDTFDYLQQLQKEQFLNVSVITKKTNTGFGASVNRGVEAATGEYILVLHNDVVIPTDCVDELRHALNQSPKIALTAPVVEPVEITAQKKQQDIKDRFVLTDFVDSCCFMFRKKLQVKFDEAFQLCHFEMEDFCRQITDKKLEIAVAREVMAEHQAGATTRTMGFKLVPRLKWRNRELYNKKWNRSPDYKFPGQGSHPYRFEILGPPDNPTNPDPAWIQSVQDYLTDEVKTEILRESWTEEELITIVSTLLIADERELLRTLEDRLDDLELDPALLILFIQYYFSKNIYSRCKHYLKKAGNSHPIFDLYRLKILVADKELDEASPLLNKMLEKYPASPDLFYIAGEIYRQTGNEGEAKSFYAIANQLDPYRFATEETAFEIKF